MPGKIVVPDAERRIRGLARRQHGLITWGQLLDVGLGRGAIEHRAATGRLIRVRRGVYAVGLDRLTEQGRWLGAVLTCGPGAVLSHGAAAAHWRLLASADGAVDITVPTTGGRARRAGIRVHRRPLHQADVVRRDAIPVTTIARTLLDVASSGTLRLVERALDEADYLGLLNVPALEATLTRHGGRKGAGALRRVLGQHPIGATRTRSELEEHFLALCRRRGIARPQVNVRVCGFVVDFFWRDDGLIVETDGYAAHSKRAAFEVDRMRTVTLRAAGYEVLRFSYRQVLAEPDWVADHVERGLSLRR